MLPPRYILLPARPLPCPQPCANGSGGNICDASCLPPTPSPGGARIPSGSHSGTRALRGTLRALGEWRLGAAQPTQGRPPSADNHTHPLFSRQGAQGCAWTFGRGQLFATLWLQAARLHGGFRQKYWSGLPFPPGIFPSQRPTPSPVPPALQADCAPLSC